MSTDNRQFLMNRLIWMGNTYRHKPYIFIADAISNIDSCYHWDFLLLNFYLRRRMVARMGRINNTMMRAGPTSTYGPMKYYYMSCYPLVNKII
ncbi:MAG TPA: hypothetical protein VEH06_03505 [Candidatus Bathyarchaeia archaeon]|nr:hypothetical protein [Candidatus Bathyarchaeia archaeon]